jgi:hypothetical protein
MTPRLYLLTELLVQLSRSAPSRTPGPRSAAP